MPVNEGQLLEKSTKTFIMNMSDELRENFTECLQSHKDLLIL